MAGFVPFRFQELKTPFGCRSKDDGKPSAGLARAKEARRLDRPFPGGDFYSSGWMRTNIWVEKSGYQMVGGVVELSIHWNRLSALGSGFS